MIRKKVMRPVVEHVDYEIDSEGRFVFTRRYHLRRGYCCGNGCKNCPYDGITGSSILKQDKK